MSYSIINPATTRDELPVTLNGMLSLFAGMGAFAEICRNLSVFGRKSFSRDEGLGGFDWAEQTTDDGDLSVLESCYLLKYVQKRARAKPQTNPWSISHALVYQHVTFDHKRNRSDHLLIKPSEIFTQRLNHGLTGAGQDASRDIATDWTTIHTLSFGTMDESFRECLNYLDEEISKIVRKDALKGYRTSTCVFADSSFSTEEC